LDASGQPTTNPADVAPPDRGALLPFGGALGAHKGSALSLAVELLGVLAGGAGVDKWTAANWGNLIIAVDPARFLSPGLDPRPFAARVNDVAARIESAPPAPEHSSAASSDPATTSNAGFGMRARVLLPGQRGDESEAACLRDGTVEISVSLWSALQAAATALPASIAVESAAHVAGSPSSHPQPRPKL
jgi:LDH2 family malate/lactate/ureidoglycolate dehydrogenase